MEKILLKELRQNASIPGKEPTWIAILSDKQILEVFTRLKNGASAKSIAQYAREKWQIKPQSTVHSLSQGVLKFKRRVAHLLTPNNGCLQKAPISTQPDDEEKTPGETLEEIAAQTEERIKRIIREENRTGVKFPYLSREIQSLATLRKAILKQREWEIKHGETLRTKRIQRIEKEVKKKFDKVMEGLGDDGGERLILAAQRFLELVEAEAIIPEMKTD